LEIDFMNFLYVFRNFRIIRCQFSTSSSLQASPDSTKITNLEMNFDTAASFIHKFVTTNKTTAPEEDRTTLHKEKNLETVKVTLRQNLSLIDAKEKIVVGEGIGKSAREARLKARIDLAQKMLKILKDPSRYLPKLIRKGNELSLGKESISTAPSIGDAKKGLLKGAEGKEMPIIKVPENKRTLMKKMIQERFADITAESRISKKSLLLKDQITQLTMELDTIDIPETDYKYTQNVKQQAVFSDRSYFINSLQQEQCSFTELPIKSHLKEILETIESNQITIISAATGSGKTTQVPQYILELYKQNSVKANIFVTQPRRIAAISIARRIASELNEPLGKSVGYCVRFDSRLPTKYLSKGTISMVTSGILLKMLQADPLLSSATHLILDEVHERDVFTDTLLLIVKMRLLEKRPDLRIILMSATMSSEKMIDYFKGFRMGKILNIAGTNFPIKPHYLEDIQQMIKGDQGDPETVRFLAAESTIDTMQTSVRLTKASRAAKVIPTNYIADLISKIDKEGDLGGILVFMPGWEEMMSVLKYLSGKIIPSTSSYRVYVLHSSGSMQCDLATGLPLPEDETTDVFTKAPRGVRKIVLATNIAESSVTIPDIVHVIDCGRQKVLFYDSTLRINCLETAWTSKANVKQRMGRAGRCQPGNYYIFMGKERFNNLPDIVPPEISRLDLAEVCLGLKASGLEEDCETILKNACDPPSLRLISMATEELKNIGAFKDDHSLTHLGKALSKFPIHPRLSRMLLTSVLLNCSESVISAVAVIGERPYKPARTDFEKQNLRATLNSLANGDEWGDHLFLTNVLDDFQSNYFKHPALSITGLKKMNRAKQQYERSLSGALSRMFDQQIQEGDEGKEEKMDPSDPWKMTRFVLSSGFYPDVAVHRGKRNMFWVNKIPRVRLSPNSCNYEACQLPNESDPILTPKDIPQKEDPPTLYQSIEQVLNNVKHVKLKEKRPKFYIFEELMEADSGDRFMQRVTAIDPLFLLLSSQRVCIVPPNVEEQMTDPPPEKPVNEVTVRIDDFVRLKMNQDEFSFMLELRALWKRVLSLGIPLAVLGQHEGAVDRSLAIIQDIVKRESNIWRR
jgi:HrpA-like RNA helicase